MAEPPTPPALSALSQDSTRCSHSRVVGGRGFRQARSSHKTQSASVSVSASASASARGRARARRPRTPPHSDQPGSPPSRPRRATRAGKRTAAAAHHPRSDHSLASRCSWATDLSQDVPLERAHKAGDVKPSRPKKKRVSVSSSSSDECIAHRTRSRTRYSDSAFESFGRSKARASDHYNRTADAALSPGHGEGLLPLDDRDFAYSPFSASTVTDFIDSDHSVYTPTRRKSRKRRHAGSGCGAVKARRGRLCAEEGSRVKIEERGRGRARSGSEGSARSLIPRLVCGYPLRNRPNTANDTSSASSTASDTPSQSRSNSARHTSASVSSRSHSRRSKTPPARRKHYSEPSTSKSRKSPAPQPRELPYLRQTSARRSLAAATGATLGACLSRGASSSQRRDNSTKRQCAGGSTSGASGSAGLGRRGRSRDMPQPQHSAHTRNDKKGKSSLGSCASSGGASGRAHQPSLATGAVASTSSTQPGSGAAPSMPDIAPADAKPNNEGASGGVGGVLGLGGGLGGVGGAGAEESSSEEGEVGRLQALLEARGLPPHLLGALGPRMQHLLHRSVSANTAAASKAAQLLSGLQATGDEGQQLQAVIEMCQLLVMGNEDTLAGFPVRQVVPALINLLGAEHNFDMMNHACRALTYMLEALPRSSGAVAMAVPAFLDKLQAITCMDVAEQSLTALDMLSRRHSKAILQSRGVSACLTYLDFFSINAQRAALSVTANCCQNLTADEFHFVRDSLPILASRLTQQDKKSVECVCLAFSRLVDSFQHDPTRLQEIATPELLTNLQQLLVVSPPLISGNTFITVVRLLWVMCAACPPLALALHHRSIADTLLCLLTGSTVQHEQVELLPRSPQELYEITCLISELMPRLPTDGIFAVDAYLDKPWSNNHDKTAHWQWKDDRGAWHAYSWAECRALEAGMAGGEEEVCLASLGRSYTVDLTAMQQLNEHTGTARAVQRVPPATPPLDSADAPQQDPRVAMVRESPSLIRSLLAVLHEVYWSSAGPAVRSQALKAILRCVYYADAPLLRDVLKMQVISSHIAGMMASNDLRIVVGSLQLAEILMQRLPDEMGAQFRREGVLHQVTQLAQRPPASPHYHKPPHSHKSPTIPLVSRSAGAVSPPASTSSASIDPHHLAVTFSATSTFLATANSAVTSESSGSGEVGSPSSSSHLTLHRSGSPLHLAEMLKRKRAVKRSGGGAGRHARRRDDPQPAPSLHPAPSPHGGGSGGTSRSALRAGAASKTSSFLSSLNPSRWGRAQHAHAHKDPALHAATAATANLTHINKEKAREWVCATAGRLRGEWGALGGGGGALDTLHALAAALPHAPAHHRTLAALRDTIAHNDLSPFEVNHSGVIGALLQYLSRGGGGSAEQSAAELSEAEQAAAHEHRLRLFLHVFADMPLTQECSEWASMGAGSGSALTALVGKVNACVSQLEQFPVRVHDLPARPAVSALKFFNTHQLMCDLKRHPNCTTLKQWKGGVVRIDPLALVQAIERYLAQRGYATARVRDGTSTATHSDDDAASDDDVEDALAAPPAHNHNESEHKLEFLIGDSVLPYNMTVYQAVRQFADHNDTDTDSETPLGNAGIWVSTHTIYYRAVDGSDAAKLEQLAGRKGKGQTTKASSRRKPDLLWNEGVVPARDSILSVVLRAPAMPAEMGELEDASLPALALLRALHALCRHWPTLYRAGCLNNQRPLLAQHDFVNAKLSAKANRQLQDPLVIMTGNLPAWLRRIAYACPFLFPFECRHLLFYVVSFDRDRALQRLLDAGGERGAPGAPGAGAAADAERVAPRLDRRKRTVQRQNILRQAEQVMSEFAHVKSLLEIQYENEVGTGLGPTLEFYALVSQELQRADLDLWHGSENFKQKPTSFGTDIVKSRQESAVVSDQLASSVRDALSLSEDRSAESSELEKETVLVAPAPDLTYVSWPCGLFPAALGRGARASHVSRVKAKFRFLGKLMAKAVMDSRMVDMPLSTTLYRWLVGEERWLGLGDARHVAPELWRSLCRLREVAERAQAIAHDAAYTADQKHDMINGLELDGCPIEELGLDFILPGEGCTELRRGGRDMPVTAHNLHNYVALVTHWLLYEGVSRQMEAFREGFESVFPLTNLRMFYPEELESVFCGSPSGGRESRWEARMLAECIRPDHGYTGESRAIRMLVDILASYSRDEQRLFLQFVTGSPRLPTGGFRALNPPLTVVRKSLESSLEPDEYLPSVMTCVNYLKLPDYSSAEVMRAKLRLAASEGQHSFHLS